MDFNSNIESIMGNPKKAINKLAFPIIFSMLLMLLNNIIDTFWVSGLNADALAALGFISPLYLVIIGIGTGIGAGANSLISRFLGAKRIDDANNAVMHALILMIIVSIIILIIGIFFLKDLMIFSGASSVVSYCLDYGKIIFLLNIVFLLPNVFGSIFRAEGDIKRATNPLILASVVNIIIDPILIYYLNLGIFGAGLATVIASLLSCLCMLYWVYIKKDTFFNYKISDYKRNLQIYKEMLVVSLPSATEEIIFAIVTIMLNYMIISTSGVNEVAAFTIVWRIIAIAFLPGVSIGIATITVSGMAYGAKNWENFNETIKYGTLLCLAITFLISACFFIFAYPICGFFNSQAANFTLANRTAEILRLFVFYNFLSPLGLMAAYVFQGIGDGFKSLATTILREIILSMGFAYLFGIILNMGVFGVYLGTIIGMNIGSIIGFICIMIFNQKFKKEVMEESKTLNQSVNNVEG